MFNYINISCFEHLNHVRDSITAKAEIGHLQVVSLLDVVEAMFLLCVSSAKYLQRLRQPCCADGFHFDTVDTITFLSSETSW